MIAIFPSYYLCFHVHNVSNLCFKVPPYFSIFTQMRLFRIIFKVCFSLIKKWNKWEIDHRIEFKLRFYPFDYIFFDVRLKVEHASRSRSTKSRNLEQVQHDDCSYDHHLDCSSSTQFDSNLDQQIDHFGISCGVNDLSHAFDHIFWEVLHIIWPIWIKS